MGTILERVGEDLRALRVISPAYAGREGELTAVLQYVYQSVTLGARGEGELSALLLRIASDEMRHLQVMGTLVTRLGAPPLFTASPPYPVSYYSASCVNYAHGTCEMLLADIAMEKRSIASYTHMLEVLENSAASEVISSLLEEEREHLRLLEGYSFPNSVMNFQ